jgi:hypothetical protein
MHHITPRNLLMSLAVVFMLLVPGYVHHTASRRVAQTAQTQERPVTVPSPAPAGEDAIRQLQQQLHEDQQAVQEFSRRLHATEVSYAHMAYLSGLLALVQLDYPAAIRHFEAARQFAPDDTTYAEALTQARGLLAETYR